MAEVDDGAGGAHSPEGPRRDHIDFPRRYFHALGLHKPVHLLRCQDHSVAARDFPVDLFNRSKLLM